MPVGADKDVVNTKDCILQPEENDIKKNSSCLPVLLIRTAPRIAAASFSVLANKVRYEP
jgi:hypothetical protein